MSVNAGLSSEPRLLSVEEAARALGVSPRFVRILSVRGHIRIVRLGRRVLVPREEIERLAGKAP